jgi:hypothetical protein
MGNKIPQIESPDRIEVPLEYWNSNQVDISSTYSAWGVGETRSFCKSHTSARVSFKALIPRLNDH